jgi:hypothetical protein
MELEIRKILSRNLGSPFQSEHRWLFVPRAKTLFSMHRFDFFSVVVLG